MFIVGLVEFIYKSILFSIVYILKLLLPDQAIAAWRNWILNNSIKTLPDGSRKIKGSFVDNPLLKYPRNFDCYCGSGFKFKMCCIDRTTKVCSPKEAMANKWVVKYAERMQELDRGDDVELKESNEQA